MDKPSSLADVAPEILASVFNFLESLDVTQSQLICNKWGRVAQDQLYKEIGGRFSSAKLNTLLDTISNSPSKRGLYVKYLDTSSYIDAYEDIRTLVVRNLTRSQIAIIGESCPKLKSIQGNFDDE